MRPRFAFLDHPGPIPFAHRGGVAEAAENTVAAFTHARSLGYRYLETDVHATNDGVVVVIHDPVLDRVSNGHGLVVSQSWAQVARAELAGGEHFSRFEELLERWPDARWNVDAKHEAVVAPLAEVIRRAGALERVCVTSFDDRRIALLRRELGPRLCTGMGPGALFALRVATALPALPLRTFGASSGFGSFGAAQVPTRWGRVPIIEPRMIAGAHRRGVAVHAWTINSPTSIERLLDLGVDGIMTDHPLVLKEVLERRQQWVPGV